ncbi:MAG: helix-turn-helix domain-containing protein [Tabrizicola sp.]|nr:helix-turn-helix domain-containing protein [Tabrizicola sp.]
MAESPNIAALAASIADPGRAQMLLALMDGRARTVSELGAAVGLTKASASEHAARLVDSGYLRAERQGRHKYLMLASPEVARLIEAMMALAAGTSLRLPQPGPKDTGLREARLCYDHLAGSLGVQLYQSFSSRGFLTHTANGPGLTAEGRAFCLALGLSDHDLSRARPPLYRDCLDWSERQAHLGGRLGRLVLQQLEDRGWLRRREGSRALTVTPEGRRNIARLFPIIADTQSAL